MNAEKMKKLKETATECTSLREVAEKSGLGKKGLRDQINLYPPLYNQLKNEFQKESEDNDIDFPEGNLIVLDASVIHASNLFKAMDNAIKSDYIFVLTSITIKELDMKKEQLKKMTDEKKRRYGYNAQKLIAKAVEEVANIIPVEIPEISLNPDDDIINALRNKENVTLWTGDKAMLLKARMCKIPCCYIGEKIEFGQDIEKNEEEQNEEVKAKIQEKIKKVEAELKEMEIKKKSKETTLNSLKAELTELQEQKNKNTLQIHEPNRTIFRSMVRNGHLYMSTNLNLNTTRVEVYDKCGVPKQLQEALEIGDTILVIVAREDFSSIFVKEEQVVRIDETNNAYALFEKRICNFNLSRLKKELPERYFNAVKSFLESLKK